MNQEVSFLREQSVKRIRHFVDKFATEENPGYLEPELDALLRVVGAAKKKMHEVICEGKRG